MGRYNLGFISDSDIYNHVSNTVSQYRTVIDLQDFNHNIVDPIKLTFDSKIYGMTFEEMVDSECIRQIDKANTNKIGYFHQNIFHYAGDGWVVPQAGFDVINEQKHIFVELKNKHNTMNSASSQKTYMKMQSKILSDDKAVCMLVEIIAKHSQNEKWNVRVDGQSFSHERIRRVSVDKFYELVFNDSMAFFKLCQALPVILDDVIQEQGQGYIHNTVYSELSQNYSTDILKSLYLLAFRTYEGFDTL